MTLKKLVIALAFSLTAAATASAAADAYPERPIRLIIPFAAGGPADTVGREIARALTLDLGQPIVVANAGGGHGVPAMNQLLGAPADGYTLIMPASGNLTIPNPATKNLKLDQALAPISQLTASPHVLVISKKIPANNLQEFIDYAKAKPGYVNFGSAGAGGLAHLGMEMFKAQAEVDVVHVPYRGTSQAITDLVPGTIHALFSSVPSLKGMIDDGTITAIGMSGPSKGESLRAIPVIADSGLPKMHYTTWYGLFAKAGTPAPIIERLNAAAQKVAQDPELIKKLEPQGIDLVAGTPQDLTDLVNSESQKWAELIESENIQIE